jgi:hypothetical protein
MKTKMLLILAAVFVTLGTVVCATCSCVLLGFLKHPGLIPTKTDEDPYRMDAMAHLPHWIMEHQKGEQVMDVKDITVTEIDRAGEDHWIAAVAYKDGRKLKFDIKRIPRAAGDTGKDKYEIKYLP